MLPGTLAAAGTAIAGAGAFTVAGSVPTLGQQMAIAAGSPPTDAAAIAKWTQIAQACVDYVQTFGRALPTSMTGTNTPVSPGPVVGTGSFSFTSATLGVLIAAAISATDPAGLAGWLIVGAQIQAYLTASGQVLPTLFVAPAGAGPLTGVGAVV